MWEYIPSNFGHSDRLKVPGGWVVRTIHEQSCSMIYVRDEQHTWVLEKEEKK